MNVVTINVPKEVIFSLFDSESEFADYVKMTIAKDLYKNSEQKTRQRHKAGLMQMIWKMNLRLRRYCNMRPICS